MSEIPVGRPLVGRGAELARLDGVLERARAGEPRAVLIAGDAGVGKTRTLDEAAARAAGAGTAVLTGHCVDLGDVGLPYLPFTEILGALSADGRFADVLAAHPEAGRLLGGDGASGDAARSGRLRLFEDMAALFAALAETAPLLLVLEDLHWADQSSRDLLRFLLSRGVLQRPAGGAPGHRLALLASYRADDLHRRHPLRPLLAELVRLPSVERLELRPLADADVARLVRALRDRPLPEAAVRRIVDRAEGNAFYAEELVAAADLPEGGLPSGLADVLLIRFERLSGTAQRVLRTAAVAGRRVGHDLLRDAVALPEAELEEALREAVGHRILVAGSGDTYSFRHALAREAVYADLLPGERARLHGAFARLLTGREGPSGGAAERAHHYRESHDLPGALAASLEAADHARRMGAPAEELRQVEAALDLWPAVPDGARPAGADTVTLTLRASAAAAHAGELHRAVALTRSALAGLGEDSDLELAARVRYTLAGNLLNVDNLSAAHAHSSEALSLIPADPPSPTWVWAAATHVAAARQVGETGVALEVARRAVAVAEELGVADARADLLISLTGLEGEGRTTPGGRERLLRARELARRAGNGQVEMRALFNLAIGCFESGELRECLQRAEEGLERAGHFGLLSSLYPRAMSYLRHLVHYTLGDWDTLLDGSRDGAREAARGGGHTAGPALYAALARGDLGAADRARALLEGPCDWMTALVAGIVLTDAAGLRGDAAEAVRRARSTVDALTDETGVLPSATVRLAALALGAVADAVGTAPAADGRWRATADELVGLARESARHGEDGLPQGPEGRAWLARAEAEWTRALSGPDPAAWERAVAAFAYGDSYERARCRLRRAEALLAEGRREEAATEADAVREEADRLGALPLRERLEDLLRRGGLAVGAGGDGRAASLTAREGDVLRLLALGHSNRRIGEELFISAKTASVHVSRILAKLEASSRTEAVAVAYREGLIAPQPTTPG
ncbi:helix-turn-helix transcriptional regulator [Streptomyces sp. SID8352]|uniref:helix-turn-helix transcriptional regulator n=1 Tax=Streptomyces sp. SID8352 TaxID=2690338 RepID=UPI00136C6320|nr:helix-turn-helix transcriptional regulator [Streptomyces sp. SID8352]MYU23687.1 AAA family ATPase [Streptomyces sp. SID8352]